MIVLVFFGDLIKTTINLVKATGDFLRLKLPQIKKLDSFAFLVHPRNLNDVYRPFPFFRYLPKKWVMWFVKRLPPITLSEIVGVRNINNGQPIKGWLLSTVLTPEHIIQDPKYVVNKTIKLGILAQKKGAMIVGLGALIPSLTKYGVRIAENIIGTGVTTGHAYTSWVIAHNVTKAMELIGMNSDCLISIVGAAGSTGSSCARILVERCNRLLLVDLSTQKKKLYALSRELKDINPIVEISTSTNLHDIHSADIVVTVTNATGAIIQSEHLKTGAIVIDDAQPANVDEITISERNDILVLKVLAHTPQINCHFDFGLPNKQDVFTCLAETMALAAIGWDGNFSIGQVTMEQILEIVKITEEVGFSPSKLTTFTRHIDNEDIERAYVARKAYVESKTNKVLLKSV